MLKALKKHRRRILTGLALTTGVVLLAFLGWSFHLDRVVTRQFEGRRWTLPARVYAEPTELYVGQTLGADALEQELRRLGYTRVDRPQAPGTYWRRGARI